MYFQNTSELSTFNEYDMMTDDDGGAQVQPDIISGTSPPSAGFSPPAPSGFSPPPETFRQPTAGYNPPETGLLINFEDDGDSAISGQLSNGTDYR